MLRLRSDVAEEQGRLRTRNARPPRPPLPDHVEPQGDPEEEAQEAGTQEQQADARRRRGLRDRFMKVSIRRQQGADGSQVDIWRGVLIIVRRAIHSQLLIHSHKWLALNPIVS